MRKSRLIAIGGAGLALGTAILLFTGQHKRVFQAVYSAGLNSETVADGARAPADAEPVAEAARAPSVRLQPPAPPGTQPLPPVDAPIDTILAELERRVQAGDSRAACRLSFELLSCIEVTSDSEERFRNAIARAEERAMKRGDVSGANRQAQRQLEFLERQQACGRVPPASLAQAQDLLVQAARAGVPQAMVAYALGHGFPGGPFQKHVPLHDKHFDAWKRDAPAMAERLARAGNVAAISMLQQGYLSDQYMFQSLIPNDLIKAAAYFRLLERLKGDKPEPNYLQTDAEFAESNALAAKLYAERFSGGRAPRNAELEEMKTGPDWFRTPEERKAAPACTD